MLAWWNCKHLARQAIFVLVVVMLLSIDRMECARGNNNNNNNQFIDDILNIAENNEDKTLSSPSSSSPSSMAPAAGPASIKCDTADDRACVAARSNQQQQQQQVSRLKQIRQLSTLLADNLALLDTWQRNKLLAERKEKREQKQIDCNQLPFKQSVQQRSFMFKKQSPNNKLKHLAFFFEHCVLNKDGIRF